MPTQGNTCIQPWGRATSIAHLIMCQHERCSLPSIADLSTKIGIYVRINHLEPHQVLLKMVPKAVKKSSHVLPFWLPGLGSHKTLICVGRRIVGLQKGSHAVRHIRRRTAKPPSPVFPVRCPRPSPDIGLPGLGRIPIGQLHVDSMWEDIFGLPGLTTAVQVPAAYRAMERKHG